MSSPLPSPFSFILYFDGSSKNNPGRGGAGAVLYQKTGKDTEIFALSHFVGENVTNNVAEYTGLIIGLTECLKMGIKNLCVKGDSLLVIQQMRGVYKVKSENLKGLYTQAKDLASQFETIEFIHVYREENKRADELSNAF
jgi:ribonuclease HI